MKFKEEETQLVETTQVKEGIVCSVYAFVDDTNKDLGVVSVARGSKTPLQKVVTGDRTIEIFKSGAGRLTVTDVNGKKHIYEFPSEQTEVTVKVGETMQWEAIEDLVFIEVCYPPYKEGRFEIIDC